LNRKSFFKYFNYIFVFGVLGTIITFSVVAPLTYLANKNNLFYFTFYDKNSFIDHHSKITNYSNFEISTNSLSHQKEPKSSHILLNSFQINQKNNETYINSEYLFRNLSNSTNNDSIQLGKNNFSLDFINSNNSINHSANLNNKIPEKKNYENENNYSDSIINFSVKDILLFSAVISATDTVAALTFIKEDKDPKLFAILFGEGVLNDAVCIVLYRIIKEFTDSNEGIFIKLFFLCYYK